MSALTNPTSWDDSYDGAEDRDGVDDHGVGDHGVGDHGVGDQGVGDHGVEDHGAEDRDRVESHGVEDRGAEDRDGVEGHGVEGHGVEDHDDPGAGYGGVGLAGLGRRKLHHRVRPLLYRGRQGAVAEEPAPVAVDPGPEIGVDAATVAVGRARDHLLARQEVNGWWKGELETNVTMDAEDLLLRHFLGILDPAATARAAKWIRSHQRPDGTWGSFFGAPPDVSTTVEAYVALRLAGDRADAPHLAAASAWVRSHGGAEASRVFTRIWLAMVGRWDWEELPVLPAELVLLPAWAPLNIYEFGCWARQTVVALTVIMAHRPSRPLPFALDELRADPDAVAGPGDQDPVPKRRVADARLSRCFHELDRLLHRYRRSPPLNILRQTALRRAEQWIVSRQEADGCWGGIQPPIVYSVIALHLQGYALDHPVMTAALRGIEGFVIDDAAGRHLEACQSPVWDTALAVIALTDAGVPAEDPAMVEARDWLLGEEVRARGDWAVRRPDLAPGGWSFEFDNDLYPDIDDTAEVILALRRAGVRPGHPGDDTCRRGVDWTVGMQSRGGGWGAFDVDNDSDLIGQIPFCDFGEVTDPPSADVTAHVIEMLADEPGTPTAVLSRAVAWLWDQQETDGSWFGRWGVNYVYGTGAAVPALISAGVDPDDVRIRRAVDWLETHQNQDGGWGEDLRSYALPAWRGRGVSTASQTGWALLALLAAGQRDQPATRRGIRFLIETMTEDGTWDEPWFTGTGFPWDFSINYHLYRHVFPLMALGRYVAGRTSADAVTPLP